MISILVRVITLFLIDAITIIPTLNQVLNPSLSEGHAPGRAHPVAHLVYLVSGAKLCEVLAHRCYGIVLLQYGACLTRVDYEFCS